MLECQGAARLTLWGGIISMRRKSSSWRVSSIRQQKNGRVRKCEPDSHEWLLTPYPQKPHFCEQTGGDQKECSFSKNATKAAHNKIRAREKFCCRFCFFFSPNGRQFITVKIASKLLAGHYKRWMAKLKRHTIRRSCYHTASVRRWMVLWPWVVVRYTEEILGTINELNTHNGVPYLQ